MPRTEQNPKKRVALRPHLREIEAWVREGRTDAWIADALGTSASSVQSFRSRNGIHRHHGKGTREPEGVFEGVLDHGEGEGWGLWLDPAVAEAPIWREHWAGVESLVVKLAEDRIVLEADAGSIQTARAEAEATAGSSSTVGAGAEEELYSRDGAPRELGRVKWFDPDKGYGFLAHPNGPDVFVHHSEVLGDQGGLEQGAEVEYEVGRNDHGLLARGVRLLG